MAPTSYSWTPVIVVHALAALLAVGLGAWLLKSRKGHRAHRVLGWVWVLSMATVAGISFAIRGPGGFSWIHGLSVFTLVTLVTGVLAARAHRVKAHRINMISLYVGALVITGLFTLLPGRLIGRALWGWLGVA
ncbi:MAG: hypothetical protein RI988_359 [Pseudomonadota bacterium]|jgi:uncharacterized membrane protein